MSEQTHDALVLGAGPAGMAMAAALRQRGLSVAIVSPQWPAPWPNQYGAWLDELPAWAQEALSHTYDAPRVRAASDKPWRALARAYGRVDNASLREALSTRAEGARQITGEASGARQGEGGALARLTLRDGRALKARVIVDATGARSALSRPAPGAALAYQIAYGVRARGLNVPGLAPGQMHLMDFGHTFEDGAPPSFLYALDLGDGEVFVEETVLTCRPAVSVALMRERLWRRLGVDEASVEVIEQERCVIPMDGALPVIDGPVMPYGAAARMTHVATGYQLTRALRWAEEVADALSDSIASGAPAAANARAGWGALWTDERRRQRHLYLYGAEALLSFDHAQLGRFFDAFFALDQPVWASYLRGDMSPGALAGAMLQVFHRAGGATRLALMRPALGKPALSLWRALTGGQEVTP